MYNSQLVTERIKQVTKEKNVSMSQLNEICGLSKNAISSAGKSQEGMKAKNLYIIAEYLDVSVDYLLGRTDEPHTLGGHSIKIKEIHGDHSANVNINQAEKEKATCSDSDETISELVAVFKTLNFCDKAKVMSLIAELSNK